jgi:1,4-alpha-glucan branching enzyme
MRIAISAIALLALLACHVVAPAQQPATSNVRGGEYSKIDPDRRVTFRVKAPNAKNVAVAGRAEDSGMNGR